MGGRQGRTKTNCVICPTKKAKWRLCGGQVLPRPKVDLDLSLPGYRKRGHCSKTAPPPPPPFVFFFISISFFFNLLYCTLHINRRVLLWQIASNHHVFATQDRFSDKRSPWIYKYTGDSRIIFFLNVNLFLST